MSTPHTHATEFYASLALLEFKPGRFDGNNGDRCFERKNSGGHLDMRIFIAHEGEAAPHAMVIAKFDGRRSQITSWESRLSAYMPTASIVTMLETL